MTIMLQETGDWASGEWASSGYMAWIDGQKIATVHHGSDETEVLAALADDCLKRGDSAIYGVLAKMMEVAIAPGTDFHRQGLTKAAAILRSMS